MGTGWNSEQLQYPRSSSAQVADVNDTGEMLLIFCNITFYLVTLRCLGDCPSAGSEHPGIEAGRWSPELTPDSTQSLLSAGEGFISSGQHFQGTGSC